MKIRLIVACLVLAILAGILYWTEYRTPAGATAKVAANTAPVILKLDPMAITKLELKRRGAGSVLLVKEDSGRWQIGGPKPFSADQNAVSGLLATVSSLNSERLVEEKANDRKPYGLDPPAFELEITEKGNKIQNLQLGDNTPAGNAVYASLAGDPRLFTVSSVIRKSIDKPLDDLRNKKLFAFGFNNPDKVELHIGAKAYLLTRTGEDWQADGKKLDADQVRSLVAVLRGLSASGFADSGFSKPTIEAAVTSGDGKRVEKVLIAKSGGGYLAKRENEPDLYRLDPTAIDNLQKAADAIKPVISASK